LVQIILQDFAEVRTVYGITHTNGLEGSVEKPGEAAGLPEDAGGKGKGEVTRMRLGQPTSVVIDPALERNV